MSKVSYTIPCASTFRDDIVALAERRAVNVADLARSVVLTLSDSFIETFPDPGDPPAGDRETVILKSGKAKGRPWRRKPRLQVRLTAGYEVMFLRRALNAALAMDNGIARVHVEAPELGIEADGLGVRREMDILTEEISQLRAIIDLLAFEPLKNGVETRADALYVLGYHAMARPSAQQLRARFRRAASVHHPDSGFGDHERMSQVNSAMEYLKRHDD